MHPPFIQRIQIRRRYFCNKEYFWNAKIGFKICKCTVAKVIENLIGL